MDTSVTILSTPRQITACQRLPISHFYWNSQRQPKSFGQLGCVRGDCIVVALTCLEQGPLCTITEDNGPVYQDSALEFFFQPDKEHGYFNFECNSGGAMLAMYGKDRDDRQFFRKEQLAQLHTRALKESGRWSVTFEIPFSLMEEFCCFNGMENWKAAAGRARAELFFNLFKISESHDIEHYGSYAPLGGETPDFHQPGYFTRAVLDLG